MNGLERTDWMYRKKWAAVLEEYAVRYGDKVKAWWIDGCYGAPASHRVERFGYTDELLSHYYRAVKKGNPDAAVTFNNGVTLNLEKYYANEDFVAGESRGIREKLPQCKYIDGARYLGGEASVAETRKWMAEIGHQQHIVTKDGDAVIDI